MSETLDKGQTQQDWGRTVAEIDRDLLVQVLRLSAAYTRKTDNESRTGGQPRPREEGGACRIKVLAIARTQEAVVGRTKQREVSSAVTDCLSV